MAIIFLATGALHPPLNAEKKKAPEVKKPVNLVWPLPPEKPRVKYLATLSNNTDVEPPKKKGWLQKMINEDVTHNVIGIEERALWNRHRFQGPDLRRGQPRRSGFRLRPAEQVAGVAGYSGKRPAGEPFWHRNHSNDNVYVSDVKTKQVQIYDPEWNIKASVHTIGGKELVNPTGLALDEVRRRLFIVDSQGHRVVVADLDHPDQGTSFGKRGDDEADFNFPVYVALDKAGQA